MNESNKSLILGLTGSLGSGKSFVSSLFSRCRAKVICADEIAREVVQRESPALREITEKFGAEVLEPDGSLNRKRLAAIVFSNRSKRQTLEAIIHPRVRAREYELLERYRGHPLIVLDVPLLFEVSLNEDCDRTLTVLISDEERFRRLHKARGMSREEIDFRLRNQLPQEKKAELADFLVDNSSNRQYTCKQTNRIICRLFPGGLPQPLTTPEPASVSPT